MSDKTGNDRERGRGAIGSDDERSESAHDGAAQRLVDVARLSHELRTPLSAIAALSEIMRDERLGPIGAPHYRGYAADIHESARHALRIVAAYVEAGTSSADLALDFVELAPGDLVTGCVSTLVPLAERAGVRLASSVPDHLPRLIADRRALRQILDNLLANAIRFTPPGGSVSIRLVCVPPGPLRLEISDTGDGMTDAELARARAGLVAPEPFRRRSGGSGIGLPLVRALTLALGATLAIDSRLREGTRVTVDFPPDRLLPV